MTLWYVARAAGLVALAALTLATALGAFASVSVPREGNRVHQWRFILQYLHRAAAVTGLLTLVIHVTTLVLDSQSGVNLRSVVIPLASSYRPVAVTLGSLAMFATVLAAVVGSVRGRLAGSVRFARSWRVLHLASYAAWGLAVVHGFTAGTDSRYGPVALGYIGALALVAAAVTTRLWSHGIGNVSPLSVARRGTSQPFTTPASLARRSR